MPRLLNLVVRDLPDLHRPDWSRLLKCSTCSVKRRSHLARNRSKWCKARTLLPSRGLFISHGQSRLQSQKSRSEIKAIHAGPGQSCAAGLCPQSPGEPGQTGVEAGRQGHGQQACCGGREIRQMVFTFGDGKAEGKARVAQFAGRQGRNLAEMPISDCRCPPASRFRRRVCTYFLRAQQILSEGLKPG